MIDRKKLTELIEIISNQTNFENNPKNQRRSEFYNINKQEIEEIKSYLIYPYENGYWELKGDWNPSSDYFVEVLNQTSTLSKLNFEKKSPIESIAKNLDSEKCIELLSVTKRISSINTVFQAAIKKKNGEKISEIPKRYEWIKKIDLDSIAEKFPDAYESFSNEINFEGMSSGVIQKTYHKNKSGILLNVIAPKVSNKIHTISTSKQPLLALQKFYGHLGILENSKIQRVFAPDEILFSPYFHVVSAILPAIFNDEQLSKLFEQALDYYEQNDYQHCIIRLGLIAEDYLQRIYTSLLREQISGGLTLGQTLDTLHKKVEAILTPEKTQPRSTDKAYELIASIKDDFTPLKLQSTLREIMTIIKDDRERLDKKIDEIKKGPSNLTPFPKTMLTNINEILKWRNAASHNTRIALGRHEADRTLYCIITLIAWWQKNSLDINWSISKIEILESLIKKSKEKTEK